MTDAPAKKYAYGSLLTLRNWLTTAVAVEMVATVLSLSNYGFIFYLTQNPTTFVDTTGRELVAVVLSLLMPLSSPLFNLILQMIVGVLLFTWMYKAFANLIAADVKELTYTPKWAVGWWFVPVGNLFKPYSAMHELFLASDPRTGFKGWYPGVSTSIIVGAWWTCWLAGRFTASFGSQIYGLEDNPIESSLNTPPNHSPNIGSIILMVSCVIQLVEQVLLIRIVRQISANQATKLESRIESNAT